MNTPKVSPLRNSLTPVPVSQNRQVKVNRIKQIRKKQTEISAIKQELKINKDFIQKQKELELKLARDKIQASKSLKKIESRKQYKTFSISFPTNPSPSLKNHFKWISDIDKRIKQMDEQENQLITQLSQACGISLKKKPLQTECLTARSNY